jgi:hypothetical protein
MNNQNLKLIKQQGSPFDYVDVAKSYRVKRARVDGEFCHSSKVSNK